MKQKLKLTSVTPIPTQRKKRDEKGKVIIDPDTKLPAMETLQLRQLGFSPEDPSEPGKLVINASDIDFPDARIGQLFTLELTPR